MITQEYLKKCLSYDPDTGVFVWLNRPLSHFKDRRAMRIWNTRYANTIAGSTDKNGYLFLRIHKRQQKHHRLAWLYVHGDWPSGEIDHINGVKDDNRISNLRDVTRKENQRNTRKPETNTSGHVGVVWSKRDKKWCAQIKTNGRNNSLGNYNNIEDAISARKCGEKQYGFHENHGRQK